jgi:predicted acylesterase/phospholipase RssA
MLSLLVALSAAAQPATTTAPATADRSEIPVTLILSGGVSLGSYEAGLSWAVTRLTQVVPGHAADPRSGRFRLVAVTGASAGSVNAVLSAAL